MQFKYLSMKNFGLYAGVNTIDFTLAAPDRPVILVGGMNGRGKTTLLEAVLLALFGKQSFAISDSNLSYSDYLNRYIHSSPDVHDAYVELVLDLEGREITLHRAWDRTSEVIDDDFTVLQDGERDEYLKQHWATYLESILPAGIAKLFFFDGEKIAELANDKTDEGLKIALRSLLGVDTVDRLIHDLGRIIDKQDIKVEQSASNSSLIDLASEHADVTMKIEAAETEIKSLDNQQEEIDGSISDLRRQLIRIGAEIAGQEEQMHVRETQKEGQIGALNNQIREAFSGALPLGMVTNLLSSLQNEVAEDREYFEQSIGKEMVDDFQTGLIEYFAEKNVPSQIIEHLDVFTSQYYSNFQTGSDLLFHASADTERQLNNVLTYTLHDEFTALSGLMKTRDNLLKETEQLEYYIAQGKHVSGTEHLVDQLDHLIQRKYANQNRTAQLKAVQTELRVREKELRKQIRELKQKILEEKSNQIRQARTIKYANASIHIMEQFKSELQRAKMDKLSEHINSCFRLLAGKQNLIHQIKVDPESLDILALDQNGRPFSKTKLSAGERQLLAISILWGLISSSSLELPVFIDTPLARLDSLHRNRYVSRYLPMAAKQVVVLSTDEEIVNDYLSALEPYISKKYLLAFNEADQLTRIQDGYFSE